MEITFKDKKLEKIISDPRKLRRRYNQAAENIIKRLKLLINEPNLGRIPSIPPTRLHLLKGDHKGNYAVDVNRELRIVFEIDHNPIPRLADNSVDLDQVTKICIIEICDYH